MWFVTGCCMCTRIYIAIHIAYIRYRNCTIYLYVNMCCYVYMTRCNMCIHDIPICVCVCVCMCVYVCVCVHKVFLYSIGPTCAKKKEMLPQQFLEYVLALFVDNTYILYLQCINHYCVYALLYIHCRI